MSIKPIGSRARVLELVDDLCQTHRIARHLNLRPERAQVHMQWNKRHGYVTYEGSRWNVTEAGRAILSDLHAERAKP